MSVVQPSRRASPALLVSSGGGNKKVRPSLDLPGAVGRVGLLRSPRRGEGGSIWFQAGPLLVTIKKLTSCCFTRVSSGVCLCRSSAWRAFSPLGFSSPAPASLRVHSFHFLGGVRGSQIIFAPGIGNAEVGRCSGSAPEYPQPRSGIVLIA